MDKAVEIRTERLRLRRHRPEDLDDLVEYANSPGFGHYGTYHTTRQEAEKLLDMILDATKWEQQGIPNFAVVLDGKVIGEVHLNRREEDKENGRAEIVYSLSSHHWNKGLTTEAARAVMDWNFRPQDLNRIFAWCDPKNVGSWRVMEKLGMKREGLLRDHRLWNGEFRDQLYYGILRGEWKG